MTAKTTSILSFIYQGAINPNGDNLESTLVMSSN